MNIINQIKKLVLRNKIWTALVVIVLLLVGYYTYTKIASAYVATSYTLTKVTKGDIVSTVTGSGQVSASQQVSITAKTSGTLKYIGFKVGDEVSVGKLLAQIDSTDAAFELESAKISYDKLVDAYPDDLRSATNNVTRDTVTLKNSYVNARSSLASSLTDISDVKDGLKELFDYNSGYLTSNNYTKDSTDRNLQSTAESEYIKAKNLLDNLTTKYRGLTGELSDYDTELYISEFYNTALAFSVATKDSQDAIISLKANDSAKNSTLSDSAYDSIVSLTTKINGIVSDLASTKNTIISNKISLDSSITNLKNLENGSNTVSLRSQQLTVKQKQEALDNHYNYAPFAGIIASSEDLNVGDTVSNGAVIATLITKQKIANISLSEVDVAKVKVGQKVVLTFDAIEGLTVNGEVAEIDSLGTVSSGVVTYDVKINLDTDDARIKPGMSASTTITVDTKADVLRLPSGAIKTSKGSSYVQVLSSYENATSVAVTKAGMASVSTRETPVQKTIEIGTSNDIQTEIISGLSEGDLVISKTSSSTSKTTTSSAKAGGIRITGM